jgi:hypothetical protein
MPKKRWTAVSTFASISAGDFPPMVWNKLGLPWEPSDVVSSEVVGAWLSVSVLPSELEPPLFAVEESSADESVVEESVTGAVLVVELVTGALLVGSDVVEGAEVAPPVVDEASDDAEVVGLDEWDEEVPTELAGPVVEEGTPVVVPVVSGIVGPSDSAVPQAAPKATTDVRANQRPTRATRPVQRTALTSGFQMKVSVLMSLALSSETLPIER